MSATTLSTFISPRPRHAGLRQTLRTWIGRARTRARDRQVLPLLSDRDFQDIGASRYDVLNELAKPFWRG
jgi:uncharacterized protein YjiS (DUF1127 family)